MKHGKKLMAFVLALVMIFGLTTGVSAAESARKEITAYLDYNITITYNGEAQVLSDVNGKQVYPVSYNGTTYVPIRAIGYLLGLSVDWDGAAQTVTLDKPNTGTAPTMTAKPDTPAKSGTKEIKTYIEPSITVKYNGVTKTMKDAAGNTVYPILHEGTTYLPIRATANMLNISVDWDETTQTVLLTTVPANATEGGGNNNPTTESGNTTTQTITVSKPSVEKIRRTMGMFEYPDDLINDAVAKFEATGANGENGEFIYTFEWKKEYGFRTSYGAETLGDKHLAYGYAEVDYSMANKGYAKVKLTNQVCKDIYCSIDSANTKTPASFPLKLNQWVNIPLTGGSCKYQLTVTPRPSAGEQVYPSFHVAFDATINDPDAFTLLSNADVDFENAPRPSPKLPS